MLNLIPVWILDGSQAAYALSRVQRFLLLTCLLFAWITGEVALPFVGAELVYRLFTKDLPGEPHTRTMVYYMASCSHWADFSRSLFSCLASSL